MTVKEKGAEAVERKKKKEEVPRGKRDRLEAGLTEKVREVSLEIRKKKGREVHLGERMIEERSLRKLTILHP